MAKCLAVVRTAIAMVAARAVAKAKEGTVEEQKTKCGVMTRTIMWCALKRVIQLYMELVPCLEKVCLQVDSDRGTVGQVFLLLNALLMIISFSQACIVLILMHDFFAYNDIKIIASTDNLNLKLIIANRDDT